MNSPSTQDSKPSASEISTKRFTGDRFILAGLGLALMLAGIGGTWMLWYAYQLAAETHRWQPHPCEVLSSQLLTEHRTPNSPTSYRPSIWYRYNINGSAFICHQIKSVDGDLSSRDSAQSVLDAYPEGAKTTCYVNPEHPEKALLKQSPLAPLYSIWFPLLFVLGGAGMIFKAFRKSPRRS